MKNVKTLKMVEVAILIAVILVMTFTPLGFLRVGVLEISLLSIPVAIGAMLIGPGAGAIVGFAFGITSFSRFFGLNAFGALLLGINPFYAFLVAVPTRTLMGYLCGMLFQAVRKVDKSKTVCYYVGGFSAAFFNTLFFMAVLVLCYWNTSAIQDINATMGNLNPFLFVLGFIGINAVVEMVTVCIAGGTVSKVLSKAIKMPVGGK